jgi:hypothetical protein
MLAVILSLFWPPVAGLVYKTIKGPTELDGVFKRVAGTRTPALSVLVGGGSYSKTTAGLQSMSWSWGFRFDVPLDEKEIRMSGMACWRVSLTLTMLCGFMAICFQLPLSSSEAPLNMARKTTNCSH